MNEGLRAYYASEEGQAFLRTRDKSRPDSSNNFNEKEQDVAELLDTYFPGKFRFTGNGQFYVGSLCPDFVSTDGSKKIIEYFGAPWHIPYDEKRRADYLRDYGYSVLVIWSWQIHKADSSPEEFYKLLNRIAKFTGCTPKELL